MSAKTCAAVVMALITFGVLPYAVIPLIAEIIWASLVKWTQTSTMDSCEATQGNMVEEAGWPVCGDEGRSLEDMPETCGAPCYGKEFLVAMHEFTSSNAAGLKVNYTSRPGPDGVPDANLWGWWLPAPSHHDPPRIVVQHGFRGNSQFFQIVAAQYLLRLQGFGVLANNWRGHCDPDESHTALTVWRFNVYDLLGAWDYAVQDSDGKLGGPKPKQQVGIMGFSLGSYILASAFGMEGEIPAAWCDSPPTSVVEAVAHVLKQFIGVRATDWLLGSPVWRALVKRAARDGVYVGEKLPESSLPLGPDTNRPIHLTTNKNDEIVPWESTVFFVELLKAMPEKYNVTHYYYDDECGTSNHCQDHLHDPEGYQGRLGEFWRQAFGM